MKIKEVDTSKMTDEEHLQYMRDFKALVDKE